MAAPHRWLGCLGSGRAGGGRGAGAIVELMRLVCDGESGAQQRAGSATSLSGQRPPASVRSGSEPSPSRSAQTPRRQRSDTPLGDGSKP
jgi:hypothetical protein